MNLLLRIAAAILCAALSPVSIAAAQSAATTRSQIPTPVRQWTAHEALQPSAPRGSASGAHGALIGAIVGGLSATGAVYAIAKRYGENETGGFCGGCFMQWGAWAIPAGALGGAAIGYGIGKASAPQDGSVVPRAVIAPVVGPRAGGIVMTVRY